ILFSLPCCSYTHPTPSDISTLSLHDALPIFVYADDLSDLDFARTLYGQRRGVFDALRAKRHTRLTRKRADFVFVNFCADGDFKRSEEHTSEFQSRFDLVCRLLLEKKKTNASQ